VLLVDPRGKIVWPYGSFGVTGAGYNQLNVPVQATYLPSGNVLITDSINRRIVQVDASDRGVWQYFTNTDRASNPAPLPTRAVRLRDGNTLISDQFHHRVIEVDAGGRIVLTFGNLNVPGFGTRNPRQGLNGPEDAKVIGISPGSPGPWGTGTSATPARKRAAGRP